MQKVERAAVSGAAISRSELAGAGPLGRELDQAEARIARLQAARQRRSRYDRRITGNRRRCRCANAAVCVQRLSPRH